MALSLALLIRILCLFLMIFSGAALVKAGILKHGDGLTFSRACTYLFQPCMLFNGFMTNWTRERLQGLLLACLGAALIHGVFLLLTAVVRRVRNIDEIDAGSLILTNAAGLVIPLVQGILGSEYVVYTSAYLVVQNLLAWTYGVKLIGQQRGSQLKRVITNPTILAIFAGIVFVMLGIQLPAPLAETIKDVGLCMPPVSMIMVGIIVAEFDTGKLRGMKGIPAVVFTRLLIYPLFSMAVLSLLSRCFTIANAWEILFVVMLGASGPSATMVVQIAQLYNNKEDRASAINVASTLACVVTLPLMALIAQAVF